MSNMSSSIETWQILALGTGETDHQKAQSKGDLFEEFVASLMHKYGYRKPQRRNIKYLTDGIEIDIVMDSAFSSGRAIAECKAHAASVQAQACTSFLGKLILERYESPEAEGYLFVLPRLNTAGEQVARKAEANDRHFHYLNAETIVEHLFERQMIRTCPAALSNRSTDCPAVVITPYGIFSCIKMLNPETMRADGIRIWGLSDAAPSAEVLALLSADPYAQGLPIETIGARNADRRSIQPADEPEQVIAFVHGSTDDFEYQLPAAPKFFVGRKSALKKISSLVSSRKGTIVLNAKSGWGKSSLALQIANLVESRGGTALVIDSRTASSPRFVVEALRKAAHEASGGGILKLPADISWASLASSLRTYEKSTWKKKSCLLVFFDQFESVFRSEEITREFRDLVLAINDIESPLIIGFAWKSDLLALAELHPYHLIHDINTSGLCLKLDPMDAHEVNELLRRLRNRVGSELSLDLRQRLQEYSQGYPWLFKKLAGHVIRELTEHNVSQERLVSEGLNVQRLFQSDLDGLTPLQHDALNHVAKHAPVATSEVSEQYDPAVLGSLLNARLLVAVGDKLDTYWDIFRDFLNTGEVPIEDSYIVRQSPRKVSPLLLAVVRAGGNASVPELCGKLNRSSNVVFNLSRELRLFGLTAYEPNRVRLLDEVINAEDLEQEIRSRITSALKRHRCHSQFVKLTKQFERHLPLSVYARSLQEVFPAVTANTKTWTEYARAFSLWLEYCGIATVKGNEIYYPCENPDERLRLLDPSNEIITRNKFSLHYSPGPCLKLLVALHEQPRPLSQLNPHDRRLITLLNFLGLVEGRESKLVGAVRGSVLEGRVSTESLMNSLLSIPGGRDAIDALRRDPGIENFTLGEIIRRSVNAPWEDVTIDDVGARFRQWAKAAGSSSQKARRLTSERRRSQEARSTGNHGDGSGQLSLDILD